MIGCTLRYSYKLFGLYCCEYDWSLRNEGSGSYSQAIMQPFTVILEICCWGCGFAVKFALPAQRPATQGPKRTCKGCVGHFCAVDNRLTLSILLPSANHVRLLGFQSTCQRVKKSILARHQSKNLDWTLRKTLTAQVCSLWNGTSPSGPEYTQLVWLRTP